MKNHQQTPETAQQIFNRLSIEQSKLVSDFFLGMLAMAQHAEVMKVVDRELSADEKTAIVQWCNEPII